MGMTPRNVALGIALIATFAAWAVLFLPGLSAPNSPSNIVRPYTPLEREGRVLYIKNGCIGCHTQYVRPTDWDYSDLRVSQRGDYIYDRPHLLGSERTGPDLSQEGGQHSDDWNLAHFEDPRFVRPASIMPRFSFFTRQQMQAIIAYVQCLGFKMADERMARQIHWHRRLLAAYRHGEDDNASYLAKLVPRQWMTMPNPYAATQGSVQRGKFVYQQMCIFCHGPVGDGNGPAARYLNPKPMNFTLLKRHRWSGGMIYYQVMNGITGSAMPYFKEDLESAKIWDVANYVAVNFIGRNVDSGNDLNGIPASREGAIPGTKPLVPGAGTKAPVPGPARKVYPQRPSSSPQPASTPAAPGGRSQRH